MPSEIHGSSSWADDDKSELQKRIENSDGTVTIIEVKETDDGKKAKFTRTLRMKTVKSRVSKAVADRKEWAKFGEEKGNKPGPDLATTTIGEVVPLKLDNLHYKSQKDVETPADAASTTPKAKNIACRICKGEHFTSKCPYKDTLQPLGEPGSMAENHNITQIAGTSARADKYIPPHLKNNSSMSGGSAPSESVRDDTKTLRVTNLSEEAVESELRAMFHRFGEVDRVFIGRDRDTGMCKGFAFVSFFDIEGAERAQAGVHGKGYNNLILDVRFAKK